MNADDRLSLDPLGRVEGGDGIVEGSHVADVGPQPPKLTSQGLALDIPSGYGSQEPGVEEVRMAVLYAFSSRLISSSEFINVADRHSRDPEPESDSTVSPLGSSLPG